ncbi:MULTISPECIES: LacI family DNA-binding transcriptional regulator [unclassified Agarivorans]|uniref:LacI family DNA-binding transcriptional regulator n=1 Tax=unclassified Agarivorans TaxID=2636026 RepID=UPI003D7C7970
MNKRTTIADVAEYLGVNKSTISRALNNPNRVSADVHSKVIEACKVLNYIPNVAAKTLALSSSKSIVLIIPSFTNSVFAEIISAAKISCESLGYNLLIGDSSYTTLGEEKVVENFLSRNVDGFIFTETEHSLATQTMIKNSNIPAVEIMDILDKPTFDANFGVNQSDAATELTEYLISKERKNIAFCSTWLDRRAMLRKTAWELVMEKHGLDYHRFINTKERTSFHNGANAISEILNQWPETDAIFFVNDDMAAGAIMQCQRYDIKVGKDIDIVGFNDLDFAEVINPRLTTIRIPRVEMAELAVTTIISLIEQKGVANLHQTLPYELMIRESA